jgi:hypothetical protein
MADPTFIGSKKLKGLSPEEWTDAAVRSLTDDALKRMVQSVASLFKTLKDEAIRRGLWDELKGLKP